MDKQCHCCEQLFDQLREYPVLNVSVCRGCHSTLDRLGGVQLRRVEQDITPDIKRRFLAATKKMRTPKTQKKG